MNHKNATLTTHDWWLISIFLWLKKITVSTILWNVEKEKYIWIKIRTKTKHFLTKSYGNCKRLYFKNTFNSHAVLHSTVYVVRMYRTYLYHLDLFSFFFLKYLNSIRLFTQIAQTNSLHWTEFIYDVNWLRRASEWSIHQIRWILNSNV